MADPIACLKLALTPNLYLSPLATPETVQQCLAGPADGSTKSVSDSVIRGALALIPLGGTAGKLARNAARFGARAAAKGAKIHRPITNPTSSSPSGNPCLSPFTLGLQLVSGVLLGPSSLLISPLGTPHSLPQLCEPDHDPLLQGAEQFLNDASDKGADLLMDTFGPKPALWLAETFGL